MVEKSCGFTGIDSVAHGWCSCFIKRMRERAKLYDDIPCYTRFVRAFNFFILAFGGP